MDFHRDMSHCQISLRVAQSFSHVEGGTDRKVGASPSEQSSP